MSSIRLIHASCAEQVADAMASASRQFEMARMDQTS